MNSHVIRNLFRSGALLLLTFCLTAPVAFASTVQVYYSDGPCWTTSPHCPGEEHLTDCNYYDSNGRPLCPYDFYYDGNGNIVYLGCYATNPNYCPSNWSYQKADSVDLSSSPATLSSNYLSPLTLTKDSPINITSTAAGAAYPTPYQYNLYVSQYDWKNHVWSADSLLQSGTSTGSFPWNWTPTQPGRFVLRSIVRANYVRTWDDYSPYYYFDVRAATPVSIQTASLPSGTVGQWYSTTLLPAGGVAPYTWECMDINLCGLSLSATGELSGTPVCDPGGIIVWVSDSQHPPDTSTPILFPLNIATPPPTISAISLPIATAGAPYSATLSAEGGELPYTWIDGSAGRDVYSTIPPGLSLNTTTGIISGTPGGWTGTHTFTIQLKDNLNHYAPSKVFTINVYPQLTIDTSSPLPNGTVGVGYSQILSASGGNSNYTWSLSGSSLPSGLSLTKLSATTGLISGTPSAACINGCNFTVKITDTQSPTAVTTTPKPFSITIYDQLRDTSVMGTSPKFGVPYSFQLSAAGGKAPYYWTKTSGNLPTGLTLNQSTGLISGTPTALGNYPCTITTSDSQSPAATVPTGWNFSIAYDSVTITNANTLPPGNVGIPYSNFINVTGGDGTYTWSKTAGTLPTGISLNTATGELYGTPTTAGDYSFTITANDGVNPTASKSFTIKINSPPAITTTSIVAGNFGVAYSQGIATSGGSGTYTWSMPVAPAGLVIDANSGTISGIPADIGQFTINVQAADAQNQAAFDSKSFTLIVKNSLTQNSQNSSVIGCEASSLVCTNSTTDVITGIVNHDQELFTTKGGMQNIAISLFYKSLPANNGSLGTGWSHSYDIFLTVNSDGSIIEQDGSGRKSYYTKNGSNFDSPPGDYSTLSTVTGGYKIAYRDGSSYNFNSVGKITSISDRFENAITIEYPSAALTTIADPAYRTASIAYDLTTTPPRISTVTDPAGNVYNFSYQGTNCSDRLCRVTHPAATTGAERGYWEYQYNPNGMLQSKRDPNGSTSQYSYYTDKRMQTATDPNGRTRTIVYPTTTSTLTEKDDGQWLYTYDSQTGAIKQKTDPNGKKTDFYYNSNGFIKAKSEPKDGAVRLTTFYKYDSYGNIEIETEPVDISGYSPAIDLTTDFDIASLANKTPPIKAARHYSYDTTPGHFDRITSIADERGATTLTTSFVYLSDAYGEVVTATATPGNYVTVTRRNADGTIRQITDANVKTTSFNYQENLPSRQYYGTVGLPASIIAQDGTRTTFDTYDKKGNPFHTSIIDSTGTSRLRIFTTHDKLGRLTDVLKYPNTPDDSFESQYSYDLVGNMTAFMDAEQSVNAQGASIPLTESVLKKTKYEYNYNRQVTKITDAKQNDTVFKYSGSEKNGVDQLVAVYDANFAKLTPLDSQPHTAFSYDKLGRLEYETDQLGKRMHYTYYDNGQLHEKYDATAAAPGTLLVTYAYNNRGQVTDKTFTDDTYEHFTYYPDGKLWTAANQNISYTYNYSTDGRLQNVVDTTNNRTISYDQYDNLGQRKQVTILKGAGADERIISYDYDTANRPWQIKSNFGTPDAKTFTYAYDNLGRRDTLAYPNGTSVDWDFDDLNRLTALTHKDGTTPFAAFNYNQYDDVGNRKSVTGSRNETYGYDELYRVTSLAAATKSEGFTYDPAGNRLTGPGESDTAYQSNAANQMTQGRKLTYGYDNRGNQNKRTVTGVPDTEKGWTLDWDYENRLKSMTKVKKKGGVVLETRTVTYKYDPFGRRIEKKFEQSVDVNGQTVTETETTQYVYDNEDIVVEYFTTSVGTEKNFFTHGPGIDEPLALERSGSYYYFHTDGLGSITHITNSDKTAVQSYTYDAYGMATASSDFRNSYQHTGREYDWETGTLYMRERTRDLMDGNFLSKDPLSFQAGDINLYRYVGGNVTNFTDPTGLCIEDACIAEGAMAVTAIARFIASPTGQRLISSAQRCAATSANNVTVYVSRTAEGVTRYAGITNNFIRRAGEHLTTKGISIEPLMKGLTRSDARAIEQALIETHGLEKNQGTLINMINSISPKNPAYSEQLQKGYELLKSIGY